MHTDTNKTNTQNKNKQQNTQPQQLDMGEQQSNTTRNDKA